MAREYASFLLRCWRLRGGEQRLRVEHIQSGESTLATTLEEALAWLAARWGDEGIKRGGPDAGQERGADAAEGEVG